MDGSENIKERETPSYGVNYQAFANGEELVDDGSKVREMKERTE